MNTPVERPASLDDEEVERRKLIDAFARPSLDRSAPLVFVGRDREIAWLDSMRSAVAEGGEGMTAVLRGIPGSGKTALCREFCRRAEAEGAVAVSFTAKAFTSPLRIAHAIAVRLVEKKRSAEEAGLIRKALDRMPPIEVGFEAMGFGGSLKTGRREATGPLEGASMPGGLDLGGTLHGFGIPRDVTVVCFVDEAQNLPKASEELVAFLHSGMHGWRILPVFAGLPGTYDRIRSFDGMSRLGSESTRTIGPLEPGEGQQSIEGACRRFGVEESGIPVLGPVLAKPVHDFPAHIASAVCAVARTMQANGHAFPLAPGTGEDPVEQCLAEARRLRSHYYAARLRSAGNPPSSLLAVLARAAKRAPDGWADRETLRAEYERVAATLQEEDRVELRELVATSENAGILRTVKREPSRAVEFQFVAPTMIEEIEGLANGEIRHDFDL